MRNVLGEKTKVMAMPNGEKSLFIRDDNEKLSHISNPIPEGDNMAAALVLLDGG